MRWYCDIAMPNALLRLKLYAGPNTYRHSFNTYSAKSVLPCLSFSSLDKIVLYRILYCQPPMTDAARTKTFKMESVSALHERKLKPNRSNFTKQPCNNDAVRLSKDGGTFKIDDNHPQ
ncbi:unnamed protein product [Xylocopa violacea]|uniref:Uncharacterized protein n=1 Tax=Xylocopa violacea TaxID=135666 RepID=A0ABP1NKE1_XYLVO